MNNIYKKSLETYYKSKQKSKVNFDLPKREFITKEDYLIELKKEVEKLSKIKTKNQYDIIYNLKDTMEDYDKSEEIYNKKKELYNRIKEEIEENEKKKNKKINEIIEQRETIKKEFLFSLKKQEKKEFYNKIQEKNKELFTHYPLEINKKDNIYYISQQPYIEETEKIKK